MDSNRTFMAMGYGEKNTCCALVRRPGARVAQVEVLLEEEMLARMAVPRSIVPAL